jgi:hypothetical protein
VSPKKPSLAQRICRIRCAVRLYCSAAYAAVNPPIRWRCSFPAGRRDVVVNDLRNPFARKYRDLTRSVVQVPSRHTQVRGTDLATSWRADSYPLSPNYGLKGALPNFLRQRPTAYSLLFHPAHCLWVTRRATRRTDHQRVVHRLSGTRGWCFIYHLASCFHPCLLMHQGIHCARKQWTLAFDCSATQAFGRAHTCTRLSLSQCSEIEVCSFFSAGATPSMHPLWKN